MSPSEPTRESGKPSAERMVGGRYRLDRVLGRGTMGAVWAGYDEVLRRPVAVKEVLLPPGIPEHEADLLRERTMREARAIAVLSHPNVVTLYDVARQNGEPFVVMELVPSHSLAEVLRAGGPLDTPRAAMVADAVAAALDAAHRAGITHRDVKPGNVLVGEDGRIKLTDFGIARNVSEPTVTGSGIVLGSPAFIAPEVASGGPVTPSADLWGLGATLFAAVEGRPPYDADANPLATVNAVVRGEVPRPTRAGRLEHVIVGLMVKDPAARMSLAEVRRRLHPLLPEGPALLSASGQDAGHDDTTDDARKASTRTLTFAVPGTGDAQAQAQEPVLLAANPGPLPFAHVPRTPGRAALGAPRRRRRLLTALVAVLATVLFVSAAGAGFALVRVASAKDVLPPNIPAPTATPAQWSDLATRSASASASDQSGQGGQGGQFSIKVPRGWTMFHEQRSWPGSGLPPSADVHFLSPDGRQQITVERFANFYPAHAISQYIDALKETAAGPHGEFVPMPPQLVQGLGPGGFEQAQEMTYRTYAGVQTNGSKSASQLGRSTFVRMLPQNNDLWVLSVTVPTEQESPGRTGLFDAITPTFAPSQ